MPVGDVLSFCVKRRLITIAIFVLAGAVVNVAVAWGSRLRFNGKRRRFLEHRHHDE